MVVTYIGRPFGTENIRQKDAKDQCIFSNQKPSVTYAENVFLLHFKHINILCMIVLLVTLRTLGFNESIDLFHL